MNRHHLDLHVLTHACPTRRSSDLSEIRVIVVSGAGDQAFSAGADISEFEEKRGTEAAVRRYEEVVEAAIHALTQTPKPTLAMIRGFCVGGGLEIAISCDLRLAAEDARFGIPAARLGLGYARSEEHTSELQSL